MADFYCENAALRAKLALAIRGANAALSTLTEVATMPDPELRGFFGRYLESVHVDVALLNIKLAQITRDLRGDGGAA